MIISQPFEFEIASPLAKQPLLALGQEQPNINQDYNKGKFLLEDVTGIGGAKGRIKLADDKLAEIFDKLAQIHLLSRRQIFRVDSLLRMIDGGVSFDEFKTKLQGEFNKLREKNEEMKQDFEEVMQNLENIEDY